MGGAVTRGIAFAALLAVVSVASCDGAFDFTRMLGS
jgi:hypothetical protein